jgi:RimJ/RimL family protein N-acetyltransferase
MMAWADIAVSAGGSTCWEMALMGLPQVIICLADNQISNAEALEREAISVDLGWHQDITEERIAAELKILMLNSAKRLLMSQKSKALVDGNGGQRISNVITDNLLKLRPMHWEDCERVWGWVNDLSVRSGSFSETLITWKEHICWFRERSNSPFFYMALNQEDLPVGQVRFDQKESETIISLMIDGSFRNSGYGTNLIRIGCEKLFSNSNVMTVHAYLKPDNKASQTAFLRAGFKERPVTVYQGHSACHFILEKYQICI